MSTWRDDTTTRLRALGRALRQPGPERDALLLLVKAAVAAVVAWQFALHVLHSSVPFYAPMAALLVVDRTMVRSLAASVQRIAAVVLGLGVAWVVAIRAGITSCCSSRSSSGGGGGSATMASRFRPWCCSRSSR